MKKAPPPAKVFNSALERRLVTLYYFDHTIEDLNRIREKTFDVSIAHIVEAVKNGLEVSSYSLNILACNHFFSLVGIVWL
jgi:hypothetical protein